MTVEWLPHADLVEWLALRRIARGAVGFAHGRYFDGAHPMTADVAAVVPVLIDAGHVALSPADVWRIRRASLTVPRGLERFAELTSARRVGQVDDDPVTAAAPGPAVRRGGPMWAVSTFDDRSHAVTANSSRPVGKHVARCGLVLDSSVALYTSPDGSRVCGTCTVLVSFEDTR